MQLKDVMNLEEYLFHPTVSYSGVWQFGDVNPQIAANGKAQLEKDILFLNAKEKRHENLFQTYIDKDFYKPLAEAFDSQSLASYYVPLIILNETTHGRTIQFSVYHFLEQTMDLLLEQRDHWREEVKEFKEPRQFLTYLHSIFKAEKNWWIEIQNQGENSCYYQEIMEQLERYHLGDFVSYTDQQINSWKKRTIGCKYLDRLFDREIALDQLVACYDFDIFCLLACKSAVNGLLLCEQQYHQVSNCASYLHYYFQCVDIVKEVQPNYNCRIQEIEQETGKKKWVDIEDMRKVYQRILVNHPEYTVHQVDLEQLLETSGIKKEADNHQLFSNRIREYLEKQENVKQLQAAWRILPKGKVPLSSSTVSIPSPTVLRTISEEEKIRRNFLGHQFLEQSDYIFRLYGINQFEGYAGFIYPTGNVVFEKQAEPKKRDYYNATYVMSLYQFLELSKLTRRELVEKIACGEINSVKRVYHQANMEHWKARITQYIKGNDYSMETLDYIHQLLCENMLTKRGRKS